MTAEITEDPIVPPVPEADAPSDDAPYGWMTDPVTGQTRPRKRPGRRSKNAKLPGGKSPALEELQALGSLPDEPEDTAPAPPPKGRRKAMMKAELPPFRAGVISKGVNRLYRRAGRIIRLFDQDVGTAVIACTMTDPDDDEDLTVGEAWENLAKTNPRIRAFALRIIQGGAWGGLFTAHLPILMAIAMKDGIRERIPFMAIAETLLTDDPQEPGQQPQASGMSQMMGGINPDDVAQMMAMAQGMMGQMAMGVPRPANTPREPVNGAVWAQDAPREHAADSE